MSPEYNERGLLIELEPEAGRLYDRHVKVAQEWFPHDYIPYRLGRDFEKDPWTPEQPRLTGVAQTAFEVNLLTEDNLPSYHRLIHGMFGAGDGAWINWIGRWTAEEGRHSIVLRDYLIMSGHIDPVILERARMAQVTGGVSPQPTSISDAFAYLALQELATRIAHHNTGKALSDIEGYGVMKRVAADENLHYLFYRDLVSAALEIDPSGMVEAIKRQVIGFEMPGTGITGFAEHARAIAQAGIYDLRVHHDSILRPVVLGHWDIAGRQGLTPAAEKAQTRLVQFITRLGRASTRAMGGARPEPMVEVSSR